MQIINRQNEILEFDITRIYNAVDKAFIEVKGETMPVLLQDKINRFFLNYPEDTVFEIEKLQDIVEEMLMRFGQYDVARAYILYRTNHAEIRLLKERVDYIEDYIGSHDNAASTSETDANANVSIKNVANLDGELYKTQNRKIQRMQMRKTLHKMFPQYEQQYERDLTNHIIYAHDEATTALAKPYCYAISMHNFLKEGTSALDGINSTAPKNLNGFAGQFSNLIFLLSSQARGAVAIGEFFNVLHYYCVKDFGQNYYKDLSETVSLKPKKTIRQVLNQIFQQITYTINQPAGNRGYQSPFTNISYYDSNYWKAMFGDYVYPDGTKPVWEAVNVLQQSYMSWLNEERRKTLLTFPVETVALLSDGKDIIDKEYKNLVATMYAAGHSFFTYISDNPDSLASCCRLRNAITDNTFTFTNGLTGVQTGSANVITLNMNRIIQMWARDNGYTRDYLQQGFFDVTESFADYLTDILERVYCYQKAYKARLYNLEEKGMISASNAGYISMKKLYSTIGVNGINEAAEFVGLECSYNEKYRDFCRLVTGTISEQNKLHSTNEYLFNQEFVPAESLSSKNYKWDMKDGFWVPEDRVLYNSYFYLADDPQTSVLDKFRLHGKEFTETLDGGVGLHCNLQEHLSKEQYLKLIDFAVKQGTSYFTFNVPNSECPNKDCHYIVKLPMDICPHCGSKMRQWTRIIGYLRPIEDYDKYRKIEAERRCYSSFVSEKKE